MPQKGVFFLGISRQCIHEGEFLVVEETRYTAYLLLKITKMLRIIYQFSDTPQELINLNKIKDNEPEESSVSVVVTVVN